MHHESKGRKIVALSARAPEARRSTTVRPGRAHGESGLTTPPGPGSTRAQHVITMPGYTRPRGERDQGGLEELDLTTSGKINEVPGRIGGAIGKSYLPP